MRGPCCPCLCFGTSSIAVGSRNKTTIDPLYLDKEVSNGVSVGGFTSLAGTGETSVPSTSTAAEDRKTVVDLVPAAQEFGKTADSLERDGIVPDPLPEETAETESPRSQLFGSAMVAAMTGRMEELKLFLRKEPWLLNASDDSGRTLLMYACLCDRATVVQWLLEKGTRAEVRDRLDRTAVHWAAQKGAHRCLDRLLGWPGRRNNKRTEELGCFVGDSEGVSALHFAARLNSPKCLQIMLNRVSTCSNMEKQWASVVDSHQRSPLHWAATAGRVKNLEILLSNRGLKLNVDQTDDQGRTPLMWAIGNKNPNSSSLDCLKLILNAAPWSSASQDRNGLSPVHLAATWNNLEALKIFLERKEDGEEVEVNVLDNDFRTPLHWAARLGHQEIVDCLMRNGANEQMKDRWGATPLHYAAQNNFKSVVQSIIELGSNRDQTDGERRSAFMWAAAAGSWDTVAKFLNITNVNRQDRDKSGATALHLASLAGAGRVVELLLDRGWSVCDEDGGGVTPLFYGVEGGHSDVVDLLIKRGSDTRHGDSQGRTVLHWSCLGGTTFSQFHTTCSKS